MSLEGRAEAEFHDGGHLCSLPGVKVDVADSQVFRSCYRVQEKEISIADCPDCTLDLYSLAVGLGLEILGI